MKRWAGGLALNMRMPRAMRPALLVVVCLAGCGIELDGSSDPPPVPPRGTQPQFGATVIAPVRPPPISGGTLTVLADGTHAVAADPDRDRIYVVDLAHHLVVQTLPVAAGAEPGRVIEDGAGRVHVALRSGGALVTIDPATWTIAATREVCPAPRGLAWEQASDLIHVACAGGELVSLPAAGGPATRTLVLDRDLRDVALFGGKLYVTRFRSAELLELDAAGAIVSRQQPPGFEGEFNSFTAGAAWRMVAGPDGLYIVHQRGLNGVVHTSPGGYGDSGGNDGGCGDGVTHSTVTYWVPGSTPTLGPVIKNATVPVDIAVGHGLDRIAIVSAGNAKISGAPVVIMPHEIGGGTGGLDCDEGDDILAGGAIEPIAVAFTLEGKIIVQSREPARLIFTDTHDYVGLAPESVADTGHAVFHANSGAGVACASCHLEGGDDGRAWRFDISGLRRTQSLRGGILGTEPFHWSGNEPDFNFLAHDVFEARMAGPQLTQSQLTATASWVDHVPVLAKAPGDAAAIARGQALFEDAQGAGCATCHNGPKLTNHALVDVGTGGTFKVPRLVDVADRAPFLHDGRATTLADRFTATLGGGDKHGKTSQLTAAQIADLVAYLGSL